MSIIYGLENVKNSRKKRALAIGVFDGVHVGHREIFKALVKTARENNITPTALSFEKKPSELFDPKNIKYIDTLESRINQILDMGVEDVIVVKFSESMAKLSPSECLSKVARDHLCATHIVEGKNFRFGSNRSGDTDYLRTSSEGFGIISHIVPNLFIADEPVSSTRVRNVVECGDMEFAERLLGRKFNITGEIVHGKEIGRTMGFPTANIKCVYDQIIPKNGAYAVYSEINGKTYRGICNIGSRPTFDNGNISVEVHLIGFSGDIYGTKFTAHFIKRLRDERKFDTAEELKAQLLKDKQNAEEIDMEKLWAPWRLRYILSGEKPKGCIFCEFPKQNEDRKNHILYRGKYCFVIMNAYPYSNAHLMVVPYKHTSNFNELSKEENAEMMALLQMSCKILKESNRPDGFNIGMNIGSVAGAGIADHLHMHIVPRWTGDINFMPVFADVRVIPEALEETYDKLKPLFDKYGAKL